MNTRLRSGSIAVTRNVVAIGCLKERGEEKPKQDAIGGAHVGTLRLLEWA